MNSEISFVLCLALLLQHVAGYAYYFASSSYCSQQLYDGVTLMGNTVHYGNTRTVVVKRGSTTLSSGAFYVAGESLTVSVSASDTQYAFQVSSGSATFNGGACSSKRYANGAATLVMPSSGTVTINGASASAEGQAKMFSDFTLNCCLTTAPTIRPTVVPSKSPTALPTAVPTALPSFIPTIVPTVMPSLLPSTSPTLVPSVDPTLAPTATPSVIPTMSPTTLPSIGPSASPTRVPTDVPSRLPSPTPTITPTVLPTISPSAMPTITPSHLPTTTPSAMPTIVPTITPTFIPTITPTSAPTTTSPTIAPTTTLPTMPPTDHPTPALTVPTFLPTEKPSAVPSEAPSLAPSMEPTLNPTQRPSLTPTLPPTATPSLEPSLPPTVAPTLGPTVAPTVEPSIKPTVTPSLTPTPLPSAIPTLKPSVVPTVGPTIHPSVKPTTQPSVEPTLDPSLSPTLQPTLGPTLAPTLAPTTKPTAKPTIAPSMLPSLQPSEAPTLAPTQAPTTETQTLYSYQVSLLVDNCTTTQVAAHNVSFVAAMTASLHSFLKPYSVSLLSSTTNRRLASSGSTPSVTVVYAIGFILEATQYSTGDDLQGALTIASAVIANSNLLVAHLQESTPALSGVSSTSLGSVSPAAVTVVHSAPPTLAPSHAPNYVSPHEGSSGDDSLYHGSVTTKVTVGVIVGFCGLLFSVLGLHAYLSFYDSLFLYARLFTRLPAVAAVALAAVALGLVCAWASDAYESDPTMLGRPSWSTNVFAWHPVLMVAGLYFAQIAAICNWSLFDTHASGKLFHVCFQFAGLATMIAALCAIAKYQIESKAPSLTTMHSWMGVAAVAVFCVNLLNGFFMGALTALWPDSMLRKAIDLVAVHRALGLTSLGLTTIAAVSGVMDKLGEGACFYPTSSPYGQADFDPAENYPHLPNGCRIAMGVGVAVVAGSVCTVLAVSVRARQHTGAVAAAAAVPTGAEEAKPASAPAEPDGAQTGGVVTGSLRAVEEI